MLALVILSSWQLLDDEPAFPYQLTSQIIDSYKKDTTHSRIYMASYAFSYIGDYQQALVYLDQEDAKKERLATSDSLNFLTFKPIDAKEYIIQRAKNEQIIILNEAHHIPIHRVFTSTLLKELYQSGFRYLGAETLSHEDSLLNQRKYPTLASGYYTKEPQYSNLIREALQLGYQLFPYEAATPEEFASGKTREIAQARHIETIIKRDPKAKILIHCGYSHVIETPLESDWEKAMAGRVKEFTGINPFTINQQRWTESGESSKEEPLYKLMNVKKPSVYINAAGKAYPATTAAQTDIQVVHPRTTYRHGRPTWLYRDGGWKPYFLTKEQLSFDFPCLVLAYRAGETSSRTKPFDQAIPVDVIELKRADEKKALVLPSDNYRIILLGQDGKQKEFTLAHKN
ncbi:hypothetical protein [Spirosoma arcticum]